MFTTKMIKLFAVLLNRDAEAVTEELLREGVMQFVSISPVDGTPSEHLNDVDIQTSLSEIKELRKRIEGLLHPIGVFPAPPTAVDLQDRGPIAIDEEKAALDRIIEKREIIRERQRSLQQEILNLEDIKRQVAIYGLGISDMPLHAHHTFLDLQIGTVPTANLKPLHTDMHGIPSVIIPIGDDDGLSHLLVIAMKRDTGRIGPLLTKAGWTAVEIPREMQGLKSDIAGNLTTRITALTEEQQKLNEEATALLVKESGRLKEVWVKVRVHELLYTVQTFFKRSARTMLFSGWLPSAKQHAVSRSIMRVTEGRCFLEWQTPDGDVIDTRDVPVEFRNPKLLAPFQMLVSNFGIPEYGTIDPTPFVMPLYLAMFGVMFADVGQGAILGLIGSISAIANKKNTPLRNLSHLVIWCGLTSMVFGALFGSYFGMPWFKPLWFDFHGIVSGHTESKSVITNVYDILGITIFFGISVIGLGLVFNWINLIRKREWFTFFCDKGGVLGAWIYGGGVYSAWFMVSNEYRSLPPVTVLVWLWLIPALLLFFKGPIHFLHQRKHGTGGQFTLFTPFNFAMEWTVELLEIFSGYLSNTLSFMRVAGLGIAHACLMISFFTLADMAGGSGPVAWLILVVGNILVIGLEGLSAGIQALRLSYYEFFTKFFHGTGKLYTPVSLHSRH